jgi:Na+/glutamate symporter
METSQHSLLAACFTLHSINATLAIVPQHGAGLWIFLTFTSVLFRIHCHINVFVIMKQVTDPKTGILFLSYIDELMKNESPDRMA